MNCRHSRQLQAGSTAGLVDPANVVIGQHAIALSGSGRASLNGVFWNRFVAGVGASQAKAAALFSWVFGFRFSGLTGSRLGIGRLLGSLLSLAELENSLLGFFEFCFEFLYGGVFLTALFVGGF